MEQDDNVYQLDMDGLMADLTQSLSERGYRLERKGEAGLWSIRTRWTRGAASGEIGSLLYHLVNIWLQPVPVEIGDP